MSRYYNHIKQAFEAFEKSTKNDWIEKVKLEYAGKNVDQVLSGKTRERLQMLTFYTEEDLPAFLPSGITTDASWRYYEYLPVYQGLHSKEFSNAISQAFEMGASGIDLQMQEGVDLDEDLFSVLLNQVDVFPISFYLHFGQLGSFMSFLNNAERLQSNGKLRGTLYIHPGISHHIQSSSTVQSLAKLFSHAFSAHYQLLGVTSAPFVNAGASVVQELAYTLSYLVACIHDLSDQGIELSTLFDHLEITLNTQSTTSSILPNAEPYAYCYLRWRRLIK